MPSAPDNRLLDSPEWIVGTAVVLPIYKNKTFLSIEPQFVGQMKDDLGNDTSPTYLTNIVLTSKDIVPGWDAQAGVYNLFSDNARLPRDGPFNQYQKNLDYPLPLYMVGLTHRFWRHGRCTGICDNRFESLRPQSKSLSSAAGALTGGFSRHGKSASEGTGGTFARRHGQP